MWFDTIVSFLVNLDIHMLTCLDLPKTKRWRNTQKIEWMTDKVADDNYDDDYDDYKVIPWIASSKSSDQKPASN